jgi:hypothetical protein
MEAGNVLPVMTRVSLHTSDVYDIHLLASQAVTPSPALCVNSNFKKPSPSIVSVLLVLIVAGWLDTYTRDNTARSYDKAHVRDPALSPSVATNESDVDTPQGVLPNMLVADTHTELSHAVKPNRAPPEYVGISSSIEPVNVTSWLPDDTRFTVASIQRTEDKDARSELNAILIDPPKDPSVTETL